MNSKRSIIRKPINSNSIIIGNYMNSKSSDIGNTVNSNSVFSKIVNGNSRIIIKSRNSKYVISSERRTSNRRYIIIRG